VCSGACGHLRLWLAHGGSAAEAEAGEDGREPAPSLAPTLLARAAQHRASQLGEHEGAGWDASVCAARAAVSALCLAESVWPAARLGVAVILRGPAATCSVRVQAVSVLRALHLLVQCLLALDECEEASAVSRAPARRPARRIRSAWRCLGLRAGSGPLLRGRDAIAAPG
jgi:hypothetical protein